MNTEQNKPFLSVVIPAYKAGKTIKRCIRSLHAALGKVSFEIIAVDNASPDNTVRCIEIMREKHTNINLIRLEKNFGPGHARNAGLKAASGSYIWFVDADDEVCAENFKDINIPQTCEGQDVVMFRYNRAVSGYMGKKQWLAHDAAVMAARPADTFTAQQLPSILTTTCAVWNKWFSRQSILNAGVGFPDTLVGEDLVFMTANLCAAKSIKFIDKAFYTYHEDASQISREQGERRLEILKAYSLCEKWLNENNASSAIMAAWNLCKAGNLLYTYNNIKKSLRGIIKEALNSHLQSLSNEMFTLVLTHQFNGKALKNIMLRSRGLDAKIADKVLPLSTAALLKLWRPAALMTSWFLLFGLGLLSMCLAPQPAYADDLYILGGGGGGASSGLGGVGGVAAQGIDLNGAMSYSMGGGGGGGYIGSGAAHNGNAAAGAGGAGFGGGGNGANGIGTNGGAGGAAHYSAADIVKDAVFVYSGGAGADEGANLGGKGGAASLNADTLAAGSITLEGDNVTINVGALNITQQDSAVTDITTGASSVLFSVINLGAARTLDVSGGGGVFDNFNVFNVLGAGATAKGDFSFAGKNLYFNLPYDTAAGAVMLNVLGAADISGANVGLRVTGGELSVLTEGDQVVLVDAGTLTGATANSSVTSAYGTKRYSFDLLAQANQLLAQLTGVTTGATKPFSEGMMAGLITVMNGADMAAYFGTSQAAKAAKDGGFVFGAVTGGKSRFNTGSHVDVSGFSSMAGLAKAFELSGGKALTGGLFAEYGSGDYNTYNSFAGQPIKGDGDSSYAGGGVLGRLDFTNNFYADFSGRLGQSRNDFNSADIPGSKYSSDTMYYGFHLGGGYDARLNEKLNLDFSGKYVFARQNGDDITLASGDEINFDAANSQRMRLGARGAYKINKTFSPFAALNYEYEFDADVDAKIAGDKIDTVGLKGSTFIPEIGITGTFGNFIAEVAGRGYAGKREGFDAALRLIYAFGGKEQAAPLPQPEPVFVLASADAGRNLFEFDSYKIDGQDADLIAEVARKYARGPRLIKMRVEGHTDHIGTEEYNNLLSQNRAKSVADILIANGIPADKIETVGYGKSRPIADNSKEGMRKNRRVEIYAILEERQN